MTQTINISAGAAENTGAIITAITGDDISADAVVCGFSPDKVTAPVEWVQPTTRVASGSSITVKLLVNEANSPGVGKWYFWIKLTDNPEIIPRSVAQVTIL